MFTTRANTWQNHNIKRATKSSERKAKFKYSVQTLTNQKCMYEKIKSDLLCLPVCYFTNINHKIYRNPALPVVLHPCGVFNLMNFLG
jgi:hypothetical protein